MLNLMTNQEGSSNDLIETMDNFGWINYFFFCENINTTIAIPMIIITTSIISFVEMLKIGVEIGVGEKLSEDVGVG